ncbi:MAG: M24 family metallopeptidase [Xanthobacteraceae bacterium]
MHLHSDWSYIEHQFGCSLPDRFLMALRAFDNIKSVTPFILERGERRFGLFLHVEHGNVEAARLPPDIEPVFYQPYFSFAQSHSAVHASLEEAIDHVADGERDITLDPRVPIGITKRLRGRRNVTFETIASPGTVSVTTIALSAALERLVRHRSRTNEIAARLLERSSIRDEIRPYLIDQDDRRFDLLEDLLGGADADAIIASSLINVQELAGVPMRGKRRPLAAVYVRGGGLHLIESGRIDGAAIFDDAAAALNALVPSGNIALEEDDLETWLVSSLGLSRRAMVPGDFLLRVWRDRLTLPDLGAYVVTTRASRHAMNQALDFARNAVLDEKLITELDAFDVYLSALRGFFQEFAPDFRVARTLTNFHSGARTMFPSNPAHYPVTKAARTLKIDAGCLMMSPEGMMLGCSDIARTLCFEESDQAILDTFQSAIRTRLVPACAPGASGRDIHALATRIISDAGPDLKSNPIYHDIGKTPDSYERDVGHLLGRNNLAHLKFTRTETNTLQEGMIACCEYQWPGEGYAIAYEDTCLVAGGSGLNLTED